MAAKSVVVTAHVPAGTGGSLFARLTQEVFDTSTQVAYGVNILHTSFDAGGGAALSLVDNTDPNIYPTGTLWEIWLVVGGSGSPPQYYQVKFSNGAQQDLSAMTPFPVPVATFPIPESGVELMGLSHGYQGTAVQWTTANPILGPGDEGIESDTGLRKVGDGITPWTSLTYQAAVGSALLDTNAGDIKPASTVALAGATGKAADAGHVHPLAVADGTLALLSTYNISASLSSYSGSGAAGQKVLTVGAHDFKVGQGVFVYGGAAGADTANPATPTVAAVGANSATVAYQYQVACILSNNATVEGLGPAGAPVAFNGNSSLDATHYNQVSWTPGGAQQAYAVYGRAAGVMQLLGYVWYLAGGTSGNDLVPSGNAPPFLGANLAPSTQYTYAFTGVDMMGNETPVLTWLHGTPAPVTTGSTVTGVRVSWEYYDSAGMMPYRYLNIYRAAGAGALQYMVQVNPFEMVWNDYGLVAPNAGINPPTKLTFTDNGQSAVTGAAGRPPYVPVNAPLSGNLLTANQASFESGTTGFVANSNCTVAQSAAQSLDGTKSLALTATGAGDMSAGLSPLAPVVVGATYSALASYRASTVARSVAVYLQWYTAGSVFISQTSPGTATDATTGWVSVSTSGVAPATAAFVQVLCLVSAAGGAGEVHYLDKVGLFAGTTTTWQPGGTGAGVGPGLTSSITSLTTTTITLANNLGVAVANTPVHHDDVAALNAASNALGTLTLPDGLYPIHSRYTIPAGCTTQGQAPATVSGVTVTATTNPTPHANNATLVFYSMQGYSQVFLGGSGATLRSVALWWPYQTNGALSGPGKLQAVIPYPASVWQTFGSLHCVVEDVVDLNSWIGIWLASGTARVRRITCGFIRFEVLSVSGEPILTELKSDPAGVYAANVNLAPATDRSAIRAISGANLAIIDNVAVDYCTPVWLTTGDSQPGGHGQIGNMISNVWCDDWSPSLVLDAPLSDTWNAGGQDFSARITNYHAMAGSGVAIITTGHTAIRLGGTNELDVKVDNSYFKSGININGQVYFQASNVTSGIITCNAQSVWQSPAFISLALTNYQMISTTRIAVNSGAVKAHCAAGFSGVGDNSISDTVAGGATLYVLDNDARFTERFHVPTGTVLATGDNTIGHLVLPGAPGNTYLYVVSVAATGTSATDVWKVNGTAVVTTSAALSGGLRNGAAGEGHGGVTQPLVTALYTLANGNGSGATVLPVVLNLAAGLTTTAPIECRLTYCITPLGT